MYRFMNTRRYKCTYAQRFYHHQSALSLYMTQFLRSFTSLLMPQLVRKERKRFYRFIFSYAGLKQILSTRCLYHTEKMPLQKIGLSNEINITSSFPTHLSLQSSGKDPTGNNGKEDSDKQPDSPVFLQDDSDNDDSLVERSVLFVLVMLLISYILYRLAQPSGKQTGWASLMKNANLIESIHLYHNYAQIYMEDTKVFLGLVDDQHTHEKLEQLRHIYKTTTNATNSKKGTEQIISTGNEEKTSSSEFDIIIQGTPLAEQALIGLGVFAWVIPFIFFPVFVMILSNSIGKSLTATMEAGKRSQKVKDMIFRVERTSSTRFHHIAGMKEAKKEITEVVDFLKKPERYTTLGAKIPTGALLLGPPGTGKTLLAKAVAGESGVGFIPVCGSDFVELYVGMGALRVRQLFETAKKQRCIVYIDEIDAIGLKRSGAGHGEKQEQEHTLNELLTQLDGFSTGNRGDVMILASSNVSQEMLDPALIRPGRFDRIIYVDAPVISERIDIFKVHLSGLKLVSDSNKIDDKGETKIMVEIPKTEEVTLKTTISEKNDDGKSETMCAMTNKDGNAEELEQATTTTTTTTAVKEEVNPLKDQRVTSIKEGSGSLDTTTHMHSAKATESAMTVSKLQEELEEEKKKLDEDAKYYGYASFDFRALLATKSERERALINAYAERMSNLCPGFVGSDIANVCNEGAILAVREGCDCVNVTHLERSIDRVLAGIEHRSRVLTPFEREVVAHHEAGHAVAGWFLNRADPLMKVSIVPRGGSALGYAQYLPNENHMRTAQEICDSISVTLGGRVAEKIFFNHLSTGASDDLRKVTSMAYLYVTSFTKRPVYPAPGTSSTRFVKPFGPKVSNELDMEAKKLVDDIYASTYQLLLSKKNEMEILAKHLLQKEVLTYEDVVGYLGTRDIRGSDRKKGVY